MLFLLAFSFTSFHHQPHSDTIAESSNLDSSIDQSKDDSTNSLDSSASSDSLGKQKATAGILNTFDWTRVVNFITKRCRVEVKLAMENDTPVLFCLEDMIKDAFRDDLIKPRYREATKYALSSYLLESIYT